MAFVNEKLTPEQREEFAKRGVRNPLSPVLPVLKPAYWTIDKSKDVYLFSIGTHRDFPYEVLFYFSWKDKNMILPLKRETRSSDTCAWSLDTNWSRPISDIEDKDTLPELIDDLKYALMEHKLKGNPDIQDTTNIVCDF